MSTCLILLADMVIKYVLTYAYVGTHQIMCFQIQENLTFWVALAGVATILVAL